MRELLLFEFSCISNLMTVNSLSFNVKAMHKTQMPVMPVFVVKRCYYYISQISGKKKKKKKIDFYFLNMCFICIILCYIRIGDLTFYGEMDFLELSDVHSAR